MEYTHNTFREHSIHAFNPEGVHSDLANHYGFSQAVVVPPNVSLVYTSGQVGLRADGSRPDDVREEIVLCFQNAEMTLAAAGVSDGWKSVYEMTAFCPSLEDENLTSALDEVKSTYLGTNRPAFTAVGGVKLGLGLRLEMRLCAFVPK